MSLSRIGEEDKCLICNKTFEQKDKIHSFGANGKQKNGINSKFINVKMNIYIYIYIYIYTLVPSKLNGTKETFGKSHRNCEREFYLRYIISVTKFGEKNSTENSKFLSAIFLGYLL